MYGRALPEEDAYPEEMEEQPEPSPLPYTLRAGQRYVTKSSVLGSVLEQATDGDSLSTVVQGDEEYYEIQLGHRLAYVRARDVDVVTASAEAGPPGHPARTPLR